MRRRSLMSELSLYTRMTPTWHAQVDKLVGADAAGLKVLVAKHK
jgi:hypothetical protein